MPNGPKAYRVKPLMTAFRMSGWTLKVLAGETNLSDSTLSRIFRQNGPVSAKAVNKVADALHVSRWEIWR